MSNEVGPDAAGGTAPGTGAGPPTAGWGHQPPDQPGWASPGWTSAAPATPGGWTAPTEPTAPPPAGAAWGGWGAPQPPKPGIVPLRPLGVGEVLDGAISAIRASPRVMIGLPAAVVFVATLVQVLLTVALFSDTGAALVDSSNTLDDEEATELAVGFTGVTLLTMVVQVLATIVLTGVITAVVGRLVLGRDMSAREAWAAVRPRLLPLLAVTCLVFLIIGLVWVVVIVPLVVFVATTGAALAVLWGVVAVPAGLAVTIYVYVTFALAGPAVVLERQGVMASIRRSRALVARSFWRVFGILLLTQVIAGVVSSVFQVPFSLLATGGSLFSGDQGPNPFGWLPQVLGGIGTVLGGTIAWPFIAAVTVLLYVDQRMRREGLDLELTRAAGLAVPGQSDTPGYQVPAAQYAPQPAYGQPPTYGQAPPYGQPPPHGQPPTYGQPPPYGQPPAYGQPPPYGQPPAGSPPGW